MATRTVTELLDDTTGEAADETVSFGLDGVDYEIDLTSENAAALRELLEGYIERSRRLVGRPGGPIVHRVETAVDTRAVRAWAASRNVAIPERGRIPQRVIDEYRADGN